MSIGDETALMQEGDVVLIEKDKMHRFANASTTEPLVFLSIFWDSPEAKPAATAVLLKDDTVGRLFRRDAASGNEVRVRTSDDKGACLKSNNPTIEKSVKKKLRFTGWLWIIEGLILIALIIGSFFRDR